MRIALMIGFCGLMATCTASGQSKVNRYLLSAERQEEKKVSTELFESGGRGRKSATLAVVLSLVLPGAGELYAGAFETGKYSLMADAGLWVTYAGFITYGNWLRDDARGFATQHAAASQEGKDDQFEVNIGNFINTSEYNEAKMRNREYDQVYTDPQFNWQWDNDANRQQFKDLRIRSDATYRDGKFVIAALVVNRILSAFSAARAASAYNRAAQEEGAWQLRAYPSGALLSTHGLELELSKEF